jgi:hypothetical protein
MSFRIMPESKESVFSVHTPEATREWEAIWI